MELKEILGEIVRDNDLHAKWVNTLSMMENAGSRKIAACEHKIDVNVSVLKHAAEEARHAYFLKTQIKKLAPGKYDSYRFDSILAPISSYQYLERLDVQICKYLRNEVKLDENQIRYASYLLTTYAIEERADDIYPIYADVLKSVGSNISVRLIIAEEIGHLEEMNKQMAAYFDNWRDKAAQVRKFETELYNAWKSELSQEVIQSRLVH